MLMQDMYFYNKLAHRHLVMFSLLDQFAAAITLGTLSDKYHLYNLHAVSSGYPNPTCYPVFLPIPDPIQFWKSLGSG